MSLDFAKVAPYLQDPLVLVGFFLFVALIFARSLVKQRVIPPLPATLGFRALKSILLYGFTIGLLLVTLGFGLKYKELQDKEHIQRQEHQQQIVAAQEEELREFDFRLSELDQKIGLIETADKPDEKGALLMYIWRAARGTPDFQATLPRFMNTHWAGIVSELKASGVTQYADQSIAAIRDLENGVVFDNGAPMQSPGGYRLLPISYLQERAKILRQFSEAARESIASEKVADGRPES